MSIQSEIIAALNRATVSELYCVCQALGIDPVVAPLMDTQMYELHFYGLERPDVSTLYAAKWYRENTTFSLGQAKATIDSVVSGAQRWITVAEDLTLEQAKNMEAEWKSKGYRVGIQET